MTEKKCGTCFYFSYSESAIYVGGCNGICEWASLIDAPYWADINSAKLVHDEDGCECNAWCEK